MKPWGNGLLKISTYSLWAALSAGVVLLMFSSRNALLALFTGYAERGFHERMNVGAIDKFYVIAAGIAALSAIVFLEYILSKSRSWNALFRRFMLCLSIEAGLLAVNTGVIQISSRLFLSSAASAFALFLPVTIAAFAVAGFFLLKIRKVTE